MIKVNIKTLVKLLSKASKGRFSTDKVLEIKERALNTFGISFIKNAFFISQIFFIESQIEELEISKYRSSYLRKQYDLLQW